MRVNRIVVLTLLVSTVSTGCNGQTNTVAVPAPSTTAGPLAQTALLAMTLTDAESALRNHTITSQSLVSAALAQASTTKSLNAFITLDQAGALKAAAAADASLAQGKILGPLHGLPIVLKDNIAYAGLPTTAGTPALKNWIPQTSAGVARALVNAGAIVIGKTNMHELAFGITSDNFAFGAVENPYNPADFAGGSSGGTAVAVAARVVAGGLGTDTGGSLRIPPALCGIPGFRPTVQRYPQDGIVPISHTRDTAGPIARTITDIALLDSVITGDSTPVSPVAASSIRLGVPRAYFYAGLDRDTAAVVANVLQTLQNSGVTLVEADVPNVGVLDANIGFPVALYEVMQDLPMFLSKNNVGVTLQQVDAQIASPDVKGLFDALLAGQATIPASVYNQAISTYRPQLQQAYATYFASNAVDAIIFPTTPLPAQPIAGTVQNVLLNGAQVPTFNTFIQNTDPGSNAGIPGVTLPAGLSSGALPIGIELDGPAGSDRHLLSVALALEKLLPRLTAPNVSSLVRKSR